MIRKLYVALLCIVLLFVSSCSAPPKKVNTMSRIVFISKIKNNDYWDVVKMGAEAAASEFNVQLELLAPDNEENFDEQVRLVEEAIDKNADAIVLAPNDFNALTGVTEKAYNKGTPVIIIDSEINTDKINCFIGTNNLETGREAGQEIVKYLGNKGSIGVLGFIKSTGSAKDRELGLKSILSQYPDIKVTANNYTLSSSSNAYGIIKMMLSSHSDLNGLIALNSVSSEAAAEVIRDMHLENKINLVGFDSTLKEIELLEKGFIKTTIVQNPFNMGYMAVKNAVSIVNGKEVPKKNYLDSTIINKENMYTPENQKLLFPFVK